MTEFFRELIYPYNNIEVNIKEDVSEDETEINHLITILEEGENK